MLYRNNEKSEDGEDGKATTTFHATAKMQRQHARNRESWSITDTSGAACGVALGCETREWEARVGSDRSMQHDVLISSLKRYHDTSNILSACYTMLTDVELQYGCQAVDELKYGI